MSRLIFNAKLPSVDIFRPVQRLRSMGLYAGNLWKATRGERETGRTIARGTNQAREGHGVGGGCRGRGGERLLANVVRY